MYHLKPSKLETGYYMAFRHKSLTLQKIDAKSEDFLDRDSK